MKKRTEQEYIDDALMDSTQGGLDTLVTADDILVREGPICPTGKEVPDEKVAQDIAQINPAPETLDRG